jgi:methylenetetrahydrofolate reductase (NADPH)
VFEWCIKQSKELMDAGLPFLHYYSMGRSSNIRAVAEAIF